MSTKMFREHKSNAKKILSSILIFVIAVGFFSLVETNANKSANAATDEPILGGSSVTPAQMAAYFRSVNKSSLYSTYRATVSIDQLAIYYVDEGYRAGVRGDMAFIQGIKESGWFSWGNSPISPAQNNFGAIEAFNCVNGYCAPGRYFADAQTGVRAQIELLRSFADGTVSTLSNARSDYRGKAPTWIGLNGKWAVPGNGYGESIISMYGQMLAYAGIGTGCGPDGQAPTNQTSGLGYWMVAPDGGIFAFGAAPFYGSTGGVRLNAPMLGMAATPNNGGYWLYARDGGIFTFGNAGFHGSTGGMKLNAPIVGMTSTPSGRGYWMVASDGGIFAFGDAGFYGSTGGVKLVSPIVAMATTSSGRGYWLVAADGGIFAFGDAAFKGSLGGTKLNKPIISMAARPQGDGYWLLGADGGVFTFGNAQFKGTLSRCINKNASMIQSTPSGNGYIISAVDGRIATFGDAKHFGWPYKTNVPPNGFAIMR